MSHGPHDSEDNGAGDAAGRDRVLALVYAELRALAADRLRAERKDHTLDPTALANEAWLRLTETARGLGVGEESFRVAAAGAIRRVLVDHARAKAASKRSGGGERVTLSGLADRAGAEPIDLIALEEALAALEVRDARKARVVELRWFGGLSIDEAARALGVATWRILFIHVLARAWLRRRMESGA